MSVRTMARVWEFSRTRGNDLLMLLAIADFADDDGVAFPSVIGLAEKCRLQVRGANKVLASLKASGELEVRYNEGPKGKNLYRVLLPTLSKRTPPVQMDTLSKKAGTPVQMDPKPLSKWTDEPSVNHQEPSTHGHDAKKQHRSCPPSARESVPDGFADFWKQYPRKVAKAQALKSWNKLKPTGQLLASLMTGLERQKHSADWQKDGGRFIPHPATWLNGRRWEDETGGHQPSTSALLPDFAAGAI